MKETQGLSNKELKKKKRQDVATSGGSRDINTASEAGATSACKEKGRRDNIRLSRQQLYKKDVATTSGCRDNNCTERTSRQDQAVGTTIVQRGRSDRIKLPRQQLHFKLVANTKRPATWPATRTATRTTTRTAITSAYWASSVKSNKKCLEIRAQLQNPINM